MNQRGYSREIFFINIYFHAVASLFLILNYSLIGVIVVGKQVMWKNYLKLVFSEKKTLQKFVEKLVLIITIFDLFTQGFNYFI